MRLYAVLSYLVLVFLVVTGGCMHPSLDSDLQLTATGTLPVQKKSLVITPGI